MSRPAGILTELVQSNRVELAVALGVDIGLPVASHVAGGGVVGELDKIFGCQTVVEDLMLLWCDVETHADRTVYSSGCSGDRNVENGWNAGVHTRLGGEALPRSRVDGNRLKRDRFPHRYNDSFFQ